MFLNQFIMHELSLAIQLVDLCLEELKRSNGSKAETITIIIGDLACIEKEALYIALKESVRNTSMQHCQFLFKKLEGIARCENCQHEFMIYQMYDPCPVCENYNKVIIQGKELKIESIEIQ